MEYSMEGGGLTKHFQTRHPTPGSLIKAGNVGGIHLFPLPSRSISGNSIVARGQLLQERCQIIELQINAATVRHVCPPPRNRPSSRRDLVYLRVCKRRQITHARIMCRFTLNMGIAVGIQFALNLLITIATPATLLFDDWLVSSSSANRNYTLSRVFTYPRVNLFCGNNYPISKDILLNLRSRIFFRKSGQLLLYA